MFPEVLGRLRERFGPLDFLSGPIAFDHTDYYAGEFGGGPLKRKVASFEELVRSEDLSSIKIYTNGLEEGYRKDGGGRRVNIDPGYLCLERFILASCKNFSHRIHIGQGVYAELTLVYKDGEFRPLEWTYPDYGGAVLRRMLFRIRTRYAFRIGRGL